MHAKALLYHGTHQKQFALLVFLPENQIDSTLGDTHLRVTKTVFGHTAMALNHLFVNAGQVLENMRAFSERGQQVIHAPMIILLVIRLARFQPNYLPTMVS
jgi:hypothetical protein